MASIKIKQPEKPATLVCIQDFRNYVELHDEILYVDAEGIVFIAVLDESIGKWTLVRHAEAEGTYLAANETGISWPLIAAPAGTTVTISN